MKGYHERTIGAVRVFLTPWAEAALEADPVTAMAATVYINDREGTLVLSAKSPRGPFLARFRAPGDDSFDGSRGEGRTISGAIAKAVGA